MAALMVALPVGMAATKVGAGLGAPPKKIMSAPDSVNNQEITGFAMDPAGRFAAAVVRVETTGLLGSVDPCVDRNKGNCDVYQYDFTNAKDVIAAGRHKDTFRNTAIGAAQVVAAAGGLTGYAAFAVGGPSSTVSKWITSQDTYAWEKTAHGGADAKVVAVAASPDGKVIFSGQNTASTGYVQKFAEEGDEVNSKWAYNIAGSFDENDDPRVTVMATSRDGNKLLVGTTEGLLIFDVQGGANDPTASSVGRGANNWNVAAIDVSKDGRFAAVAVNDGNTGYVYLFDLSKCSGGKDCPTGTFASKSAGGKADAVAITEDGKYFAVGATASGQGKIQIYERREQDGVLTAVEQYETAAALDAGVKAIDYDKDGRVLVASTTLTVYGFHLNRNTPVWMLTAGDANLDTPLAGVRVSADGERIFAVGKTKVQAFKQVYNATGTLDPTKVDAANPGDARKVVLKLVNSGSAPDTYDVRTTAPLGWEVGLDNDQGNKLVLPGEQDTFNFTVRPPENAPATPRDVIFELRSLALQAKNAAGDPEAPSEGVIHRLKLNYTIVAVRDNIRIEAEETTLDADQEQEYGLPFSVRNHGNSEAHVNYTILQDNPRGTTWTVRFEEESQKVAAGDTATNVLYVTAPAEAANGERNVVTVTARVGGRDLHSIKFTLLVNPSYGIDVSTEEDARTFTVKPGEPTTVKLLVKNTGNTPDTVDVSAEVGPDAARLQWRAVLDKDTLDVNAGHAKTVTLTVRANEAEALPATVTVKAVSRESGETESFTLDVDVAAVETRSGPLPTPGAPPAVVFAILALAGVVGARLIRRRDLEGSP